MKKFLSITLLLTVGVLAGVFIDHFMGNQNDADTNVSESALMHAKKHMDPTYVCPMHSQIVSDEQGTCPICGMDLVEIKKEEAESSDDDAYPTVRVPSTVINNLGVRVAQVEKKTLIRKIETPGFITQVRKSSFTRYKAPAKGRVAKLYFERGQWLKEGDPLVDIELDDLVLVQEKHLEIMAGIADQKRASEDRASEDKETIEEDSAGIESRDSADQSAQQEGESVTEPTALSLDKTLALMKLAGMTDEQIASLEETRVTSPIVTLYAKHDGEVEALKVGVGDEVKSNALLFTFGGLARATVLANAFQRDASWVRPGQDVDIILPHESGKPFKGTVSSGAVSININSQNIGVELVFTAPGGIVKSGMYVVGNIYGQVKKDALAVPRDAIIYSHGEKRVIVALGEGRFKPVVVETGISNDTEVEILSGLEEGDTVVVSAQFLIDSESSLQSGFRRMTGVDQ